MAININVRNSGKTAVPMNGFGGKIDVIQKNGVALPVDNRAVNIPVPTKTSDLDNDSNFVADADYVHTDNNFTDEDKLQINSNADDVDTLSNNKQDKALKTDSTTEYKVLSDNNYTDSEKETVSKSQDKMTIEIVNTALMSINPPANNTEYRGITTSKVFVGIYSLPVAPILTSALDFAFTFSFYTRTTAPSFTCPSDIKFTGDDVNTSNVFVPTANKSYYVAVFWDGNIWRGIVSGVDISA